MSGGIAWQLAIRSSEELRHTTSAAASEVAQDFSLAPDTAAAMHILPAGMADAQYDAAVSDLEKALHAGRGHLDAPTIAIVEYNLQIIDQAIRRSTTCVKRWSPTRPTAT